MGTVDRAMRSKGGGGSHEKAYLEEVDHLWVELRAFWQRVEDQVMDASDAVPVEKVGASRVEEKLAVAPEEPRSRPSHLEDRRGRRRRFSAKTEDEIRKRETVRFVGP